MLIGGKSFCNLSCAAEYFRVSKKSMNRISSIYPIFKKHHNAFFPVQVDKRNFRTFQDVRDEFHLSHKKLDAIIMGPKSWEFEGETHFVSVPKCISMCYDLKNLFGNKHCLWYGLSKCIKDSNMDWDYDDIINEYYERSGGLYEDQEDSSSDESDSSSDEED